MKKHIILLSILVSLGCTSEQPPEPPPLAVQETNAQPEVPEILPITLGEEIVQESCPDHQMVLSQEFSSELLPTRDSPERGSPGVAAGDFTGDGWPDVFLAYGGGSVLFVNDGNGRLVEDEGATLDGQPLPPGRAASAADIDGDGDLDVFLGLEDSTREQILLRNQGNGQFSRIVLEGSDALPWGASFADLNADGRVDIYVATHTAAHDYDSVFNEEAVGYGHGVYMQAENGRFVKNEDALPMSSLDSLSYQGALIDADGDGDMDIYLANDFGPWVEPNKLLENDGTGHFTEAESCHCDLAMFAMGAAVGDPDNDGDPDMYLSNVGSPVYLENMGDGSFVDATHASGSWLEPTPDQMTSWATLFVDVDQDTCEDLFIVYGSTGADESFLAAVGEDDWTEEKKQTDVLLRGDCTGHFKRAPEHEFADRTRARAAATADLNRDGRPDLITAGKHFMNVWLGQGGCESSLRIRLKGPAGNRLGLGAKVEVTTSNRTQTRWMTIDSTASSSEPVLLVGLGQADYADTVTVTWPNGSVQTFSDVSKDEELVVSR